jgi:hypothetical protein
MTMNLRSTLRTVLVAFSMGILFNSALAGEKKKDPVAEAEATEAAAEEEAESKMDPEKLRRLFEGKLVLFPVEEGGEAKVIIGQLAGKNFNYLLKVETEAVRNQLKEFNNKEVSVIGKVRNQGKYLIVSSVMRGGAAPVFVRRKGGI